MKRKGRLPRDTSSERRWHSFCWESEISVGGRCYPTSRDGNTGRAGDVKVCHHEIDGAGLSLRPERLLTGF